MIAIRRTSPRKGGTTVALVLWVAAAALLLQALHVYRQTSRLPPAATRFMLEAPRGIATTGFREPLLERLRTVAPARIDGAQDRLVIARVQAAPTKFLEAILTVNDPSLLATLELQGDLPRATELVKAHPLPGRLHLLGKAEAPAVEDPAVNRKRALGYLSFAGAVAMLGIVMFLRTRPAA